MTQRRICGFGRVLLALVTMPLWPMACATMQRHPPCKPGYFATAVGTCVPEAWHCSPSLYNAGALDGCDCNCGAPDPDCHKKAKSFWCYGMGMARPVQHCSLCDAAPGERLMQVLMGEAQPSAAVTEPTAATEP